MAKTKSTPVPVEKEILRLGRAIQALIKEGAEIRRAADKEIARLKTRIDAKNKIVARLAGKP